LFCEVQALARERHDGNGVARHDSLSIAGTERRDESSSKPRVDDARGDKRGKPRAQSCDLEDTAQLVETRSDEMFLIRTAGGRENGIDSRGQRILSEAQLWVSMIDSGPVPGICGDTKERGSENERGGSA
jgi:hypothetical protein